MNSPASSECPLPSGGCTENESSLGNFAALVEEMQVVAESDAQLQREETAELITYSAIGIVVVALVLALGFKVLKSFRCRAQAVLQAPRNKVPADKSHL